MLNTKNIVIGTLATIGTAFVIDMTVCAIKGKDCVKTAELLTKIGMYYNISGGMFATDEEIREYNSLIERVDSFTTSMNGKKSRSFSKEDRAKARSLREDVERFYNAHCA